MSTHNNKEFFFSDVLSQSTHSITRISQLGSSKLDVENHFWFRTHNKTIYKLDWRWESAHIEKNYQTTATKVETDSSIDHTVYNLKIAITIKPDHVHLTYK